MKKYKFYCLENFEESFGILNYLIRKSHSFKLYAADRHNNFIENMDFREFEIQNMYVHSITHNVDSHRFINLFFELVEKSDKLRFFANNNSVEKIESISKLVTYTYDSEVKKCIITKHENNIKEILKNLSNINMIAFFKNSEIIGQLSKMPDHISCQIYESDEKTSLNKDNLWETMITKVIGKSNTLYLQPTFDLCKIIPTCGKILSFYYLSFYTFDGRELIYINTTTNCIYVCLSDEELDELDTFKLLNTENLYFIKEELEYDAELSPLSVAYNFDIGYINEKLNDIIII